MVGLIEANSKKYPEFGKLTLDDSCRNNLREVYKYKRDGNYDGLLSNANFYSIKNKMTIEPVVEKLNIEEKGEVSNEQIAIDLNTEVMNPNQKSSDNIEIANKTLDFSQDMPDVAIENLRKDTTETQILSKDVRKVRYDGDELLKTDLSDYEDVWEDYIPDLDISILAGRGGIGKTNLYLQLAISIVVKKDEFLGKKINAMSPSVLIIATEDNERRLKSRLQKHLSKIAPGCSIKELILITTGEELIKTIRSELEQKRFALVVIDALGDVFEGDPNSQIDSRKFYNDFQRLINEFKTAFMIVTHEGKSQIKDKRSRILGSVAIVDRARSVVMLNRDVKTGLRTLTIEKSNNISEEKIGKPLYLEMDNDTMTFYTVPEPKSTNDKNANIKSAVASSGECRVKSIPGRKRDKELLKRAIALYKEGKKQCEIAKELGVCAATISRWINQYKEATLYDTSRVGDVG